jgi:hypothetical protein
MILELLERAFMAHDAVLDEDKISGETIQIEVESDADMIPSVLQIAEGIIMKSYGRISDTEESKSQIRHIFGFLGSLFPQKGKRV